MTPTPLAWVSSGMSFLAMAGTQFLSVTAIASTILLPPPALPPAPPDHRAVLWRCPASLAQPMPSPRHARFPVKMQGCVVAYVADAIQADQLSQRLDRQLSDPAIDWSAVTPHLVGAALTIQRGSEILLRLDPAWAQQFGTHPHRLITDWANNMRWMAGHRPFTLAQAQKQMYAVAATAQVRQGAASWYGPYFHGRMTANGEIYNQHDLTAAHRDLPLGTYVQVTNRSNGRSVVVRINDRGPYLDEDYRIIDLSHQAAQILEGEDQGVVPIELVVLQAQPQPIAFNPTERRFQDQAK